MHKPFGLSPQTEAVEGHHQHALLDRRSEVAALEDLVGSAQKGKGGMAIIVGAAGVGKSALAQVAVSLAEARGMLVLKAQGMELETDLPFGVARQLFAPVLAGAASSRRARLLSGPASLAGPVFGLGSAGPDLGEGVIEGLYWLAVNMTAANSTRRERSRRRAPAVLIALDDAQWADRSSLRALIRLAVGLGNLPIALVLAARTGEAEGSDALLRRLQTVNSALVLRPPPFSRSTVNDLVDDAFDGAGASSLGEACYAATGGNPFLVHALIRAVRAQTRCPAEDLAAGVRNLVPSSVLHAVTVSLNRLPPGASAVAEAVAVLGDGASLSVVAQVAGTEVEEAGRIADLLTEVGLFCQGPALSFTHSLTRNAVYAGLLPYARSNLHRRAAELLGASGAGPGRVASHLVLTQPAGGDDAVVAVLREAAREVLRQGEPAAAARLLNRAMDDATATLRPDVVLELAHAEAAAGLPNSIDRFNEALSAVNDPHRRAVAHQVRCRLLQARGDFGAAERAAEAGMAELDDSDPLVIALMADVLAASSFRSPSNPRLVAKLASMGEDFRRGQIPADPALCAALAASLALTGAPAAQVVDLSRACIRAGGPLVHEESHGLIFTFVAVALTVVDELDAAGTAIADAASAARQQGSVLALGTVSAWEAWVAYQKGHLAEALELARPSLDLRHHGFISYLGWSASTVAHVNVELGRLEDCRAAVELASGGHDQPMSQAMTLEARAALAMAEGRFVDSFADSLRAGEILSDGATISHPSVLLWESPAALAAAAAGHPKQAAGLAEQGLTRARAAGIARPLGAALRAAGLVAGGPTGCELLAEAVSVLKVSPAALERCRALVTFGALLRRTGKRSAAEEHLRDGLELASTFGAQRLADTARRELRALGVRPRRAARFGPSSLTPAEARVARLARGGYTNNQIAAELFVNVKTVEFHLAHVFQKLAIASRRELAVSLEAAST